MYLLLLKKFPSQALISGESKKSHLSSLSTEVVVAQVVERWAGQVQISGYTLFFFQVRIAVNLFSLGVRLFLITCNRTSLSRLGGYVKCHLCLQFIVVFPGTFNLRLEETVDGKLFEELNCQRFSGACPCY